MMRSVRTIWGVEMTEQMVVETAEETKSKAGPAKRRGNHEESVALVAWLVWLVGGDAAECLSMVYTDAPSIHQSINSSINQSINQSIHLSQARPPTSRTAKESAPWGRLSTNWAPAPRVRMRKLRFCSSRDPLVCSSVLTTLAGCMAVCAQLLYMVMVVVVVCWLCGPVVVVEWGRERRRRPKQPINQSTNQSINQSINESID